MERQRWQVREGEAVLLNCPPHPHSVSLGQRVAECSLMKLGLGGKLLLVDRNPLGRQDRGATGSEGIGT